MTAIDIFSNSVVYKYKHRKCSFSALVVFIFFMLAIFTPILVIPDAGGVWLKNRNYVETPYIIFQYKYLLLVETDTNVEPLVCSSFRTYKENAISDSCTLIKIQEIDINNDGRNDIFKFEAHLYVKKPIRTVKLLLFFQFKLQELVQAIIESIGVFDYSLNQEIQNIQFMGDLELYQKGLIHREGLYEIYNHSVDLADYTLPELLFHNANKKFVAKINNLQTAHQVGFASEEPVMIQGELYYAENCISYQPGLLEELKWAWIQYLSMFLVLIYIIRHILRFLLTRRYLNSYIVIPWKEKDD